MSGRSLIAGANAWFRAKESARVAAARIIDDPWALALADRDPVLQGLRFGRFAVPALGRMIDQLQTVHCIRHRAVDELVLDAVERAGMRQVVVVGAGYDMRASRFAARLDGVRWIEVDRLEMIHRKQRLLEGRTDVRPVERVAADLELEGLAEVLRRTTFDPSAPTVFVAEGLIHYLSRERLEALLSDAARLRARARVVFTYISAEMYDAANVGFVQLIKTMQEIPRLYFTPREIATLCARHGLHGFRRWSLEQQIAQFAPCAARRNVRLAQDVAEVRMEVTS